MGKKVKQNIRIKRNLVMNSIIILKHRMMKNKTPTQPLSLNDREELHSTYEDHYLCLIFGFPKYLLASNPTVLLVKRFIAAGKNIASLSQFIPCKTGAHNSDLLNAWRPIQVDLSLLFFCRYRTIRTIKQQSIQNSRHDCDLSGQAIITHIRKTGAMR